jgi:hypothetical protein
VTAPNGHDEPQVVDLDAILARTRPSRVLRISASMIQADTLTPYELVAVGRAVGMSPQELLDQVRERAGWSAVELAQAFAWVIARRAEPDLAWEEAQRYGLDIVTGPPVDPTPAAGKPSRRRGTTGSSACTG